MLEIKKDKTTEIYQDKVDCRLLGGSFGWDFIPSYFLPIQAIPNKSDYFDLGLN